MYKTSNGSLNCWRVLFFLQWEYLYLPVRVMDTLSHIMEGMTQHLSAVTEFPLKLPLSHFTSTHFFLKSWNVVSIHNSTFLVILS